jgi:hypothetical protein
MSRLIKHTGSIPKKEIVKAIFNWIKVAVPYSIGWGMTFVMGLFVAATSKKQMVHPQGEVVESKHSDRYIAQGSSGEWEYRNSPYKILKPWNNLEDGTLGEPSGKHSARVKGDERSFISQYLWTIRNPFNYAKRTMPLFFCPVDDCIIEYWGDYEVSDKMQGSSGWHFCKATDQKTGKVYYWYRSIKIVSATQVRQACIGFKIKPSHALQVQDDDDKDKAFTIRLPVKTNID